MSALLVTMKPSVLSCFQVNQYQKKICQSIYETICQLKANQFTCQSVNQSIYVSLKPFVNQLPSQPIDQSTHQWID